MNQFHPGCAGCQICLEHMLEDQYGEEWWTHPDNQPRPEDFEEPVRLRLVEGEPPE